jgi:Protein of unknown function (DUF1329)
MYDNTFKNATRAKLIGVLPEGAYGGIPFPIPETGAEVIWNHLLRWRGTSYQWTATQYALTADGQRVMTTDSVFDFQMPYYFQDGSPEEFAKTGVYGMMRLINVGPPIRAGEAIVRRDVLSGYDQGWVYLTGQRRVRKLPNPQCCDAPTFFSNGLMFYDEIETWAGRLDRFDWKLVGKQEMYIPYNGNRLLQPKTDAEVMAKHFLNPAMCAESCTASGWSTPRCGGANATRCTAAATTVTRTPGSVCWATAGTPTTSYGGRCGRRPSLRLTCPARSSSRWGSPTCCRTLRSSATCLTARLLRSSSCRATRTECSRAMRWRAKACAETQREARTINVAVIETRRTITHWTRANFGRSRSAIESCDRPEWDPLQSVGFAQSRCTAHHYPTPVDQTT